MIFNFHCYLLLFAELKKKIHNVNNHASSSKFKAALAVDLNCFKSSIEHGPLSGKNSNSSARLDLHMQTTMCGKGRHLYLLHITPAETN